ncbi:FAD-binding oxidoreductase [Bradyrhizobium mercantei]|uniref:FAD-binding oxidoreductase n=1 Tax=Bradyrhizobium mercantei TaxID=1904807 RepID=UPI000B5AD490|nr:FAD-binding oxidoreductase [Bradyrhizobium mercantei]
MTTKSKIAPDLLERLVRSVGREHVVEGAEELDWAGRSACGTFNGRADLLVRPGSTAELSEVVRVCVDGRMPMVPQGGNTGLAGGATPFGTGGEVVISLSRMRALRQLDIENATITVEAGLTLSEVRTYADRAGLLYPVGLGSEGSCQIGGNIATNAGGTQVLRYGNVRPQVLGLEVVLPDGRIWDGLRSLRKDSAGYDMKQIFIGSEGTLGFITAAVLRLQPRPSDVAAAFVAAPNPAAALKLLSAARGRLGEAVTAFELMRREAIDLTLAVRPELRMPIEHLHDWYVLVEVAGQGDPGGLEPELEAVLASALEEGLIVDAALARSNAQRLAMWELREWKAEAQKAAGPGVKHDVSVPVSSIPRFLAEADAALENALPGIRHFAFGHLGDGNIHYNPIAPAGWTAVDLDPHRARINEIVHDIVARFGGSISAEHGIGRLRSDELRRRKSEVEYDMMRAIKGTFDPFGLMNPGKVVA